MKNLASPARRSFLPKAPTGIQGLDEITEGGLPKGRPTLVCGGAGCGKTLLAMEFIVNGAMTFDEPGVFISFEETEQELAANVASLGFDLDRLVARKKIWLEHIHAEGSDGFDLEQLFLRVHCAIEAIGAKRVVLDTIDALFSEVPDRVLLRSRLRRLFQWLKRKSVTAILTAERGEGTLTRQGLEEYVSDCVILLDHRVSGHSSTRWLRIVKYRGSMHGTDEYPFLIHEDRVSFKKYADEAWSRGMAVIAGRGIQRA